jgi:DNA polymerase III alpha subunit
VSHNENHPSNFRLVDLNATPPEDITPAGKRTKERMDRQDFLKKCDCKNFKKKELEEMLENGMIRKISFPRERLVWTMQGRLALQRIIDEEKKDRDSKKLPWPPSPDYYRKMRKL